jgi:hypothetical protein
MVYHGRVENGVVILEGAPTLPEGTRVRIEPEAAEIPAVAFPRGSAQALLQVAGTWNGEPEEVDRLLQQLREMKQAEVERQSREPAPEL